MSTFGLAVYGKAEEGRKEKKEARSRKKLKYIKKVL